MTSLPAVIVVGPEYELIPVRVRVPAPILLNAPAVVADAPLNVRLVPAVATSIVPVVASVSVNARFELIVVPVYCSVPPLSTRLLGALVDCPTPLAVPPSARIATLKLPALMVVLPV